jgi:integrase
MSPIPQAHSLEERYDRTLRYLRDKKLPPGHPSPQSTGCWPKENIALYERYQDWLLSGGVSEHSTKYIYLPVAGHILGLNLKPHPEIDLDADLERVMAYTRARGCGTDWLKSTRNGMKLFRRFLRFERGLGEEVIEKTIDLSAQKRGLPIWVITELERFQRTQQRNWRPARVDQNLRGFWSKHGRVWRFFARERGVQKLRELKRQHILDYLDWMLGKGYAVSTVNTDLRLLHAFLLFLQEEGCIVPQSLLRVPTLKQPDSLPKYLTDAQVRALRDEFERKVREAKLNSHRRLALLSRAAFYLLWQGGLRLGEVEELRLEDLDLAYRRLSVRNGKGLKDRTVYLADTAVRALEAYLAVRGQGFGDHVFLYRNAPMRKDLIRNQLTYAGKAVGVKVHAHRLRHTCATQLLNAGCRVTSIQRFLGHKKLNTTMIYARAHDQNVAEDYFTAMSRVEQRLDIVPEPAEPETEEYEVVNVRVGSQIMLWVERLAQPELCPQDRIELAENIKRALSSGIPIPHPPFAPSRNPGERGTRDPGRARSAKTVPPAVCV